MMDTESIIVKICKSLNRKKIVRFINNLNEKTMPELLIRLKRSVKFSFDPTHIEFINNGIRNYRKYEMIKSRQLRRFKEILTRHYVDQLEPFI